jgi:hypothetical protein
MAMYWVCVLVLLLGSIPLVETLLIFDFLISANGSLHFYNLAI